MVNPVVILTITMTVVVRIIGWAFVRVVERPPIQTKRKNVDKIFRIVTLMYSDIRYNLILLGDIYEFQ